MIMAGEDRSRLVPLFGSNMKRAGMWGLSAGGVGGLGLDALSFVITGRGDAIRITLSTALCLASGGLILFGFLADRALRKKYEGGSGGR